MTIHVGMWVKVKGYSRFGYVEDIKIYEDGSLATMTVMMPTKGGKFKAIEVEDGNRISPAPIEGMGDISTRFKKVLIDIALMDRDEEWFKEVVNHKSFL